MHEMAYTNSKRRNVAIGTSKFQNEITVTAFMVKLGLNVIRNSFAIRDYT